MEPLVGEHLEQLEEGSVELNWDCALLRLTPNRMEEDRLDPLEACPWEGTV